MAMISSTTMARSFGTSRGKALGIANLGYPLSEALFPSLVVWAIASYGWRHSWSLLALLVGFLFIPLCLFLTKGDPHLLAQEEFDSDKVKTSSEGGGGDASISQVLKDWRFYASG